MARDDDRGALAVAGLAWIVAGILGATFGAVYSAWIVLVEILR